MRPYFAHSHVTGGILAIELRELRGIPPEDVYIGAPWGVLFLHNRNEVLKPQVDGFARCTGVFALVVHRVNHFTAVTFDKRQGPGERHVARYWDSLGSVNAKAVAKVQRFFNELVNVPEELQNEADLREVSDWFRGLGVRRVDVEIADNADKQARDTNDCAFFAAHHILRVARDAFPAAFRGGQSIPRFDECTRSGVPERRVFMEWCARNGVTTDDELNIRCARVNERAAAFMLSGDAASPTRSLLPPSPGARAASAATQ